LYASDGSKTNDLGSRNNMNDQQPTDDTQAKEIKARLLNQFRPLNELLNTKAEQLILLLDRRDGAASLVIELPKLISPDDVAQKPILHRAWELYGLFFLLQKRYYEALSIFQGLYEQQLAYQKNTKKHAHKGTALVWISDCHAGLNRPVLAMRYLMLTTCEDAIVTKGKIPAEGTGVYFRLVWHHGLSEVELNRYSTKMWELFQSHPEEGVFPEWILQELDQEWMTEYPLPEEQLQYVITKSYTDHLLGKLGTGVGEPLEQLAHYLLGAMPGCRAYRRKRSQSAFS